jgi:2-methylisocitrate lyase-like PEP mutase family enzyme
MREFEGRRAAFRRLHESGCFAIPNPWDIGTACYLSSLGFKALATTSSGYAFSVGLPDTDWAVPLDAALAHIADIVEESDLPVNADFESGYAHEPEEVAANVARCIATGVAGLSIEDATGKREQPLYPLEAAVARIKAARRAIDASGTGVLLTGRAECYLVGHADPLKESIRRLAAYAEAGADVLYAPGPRKPEDIAAIVKAVAPKPVNLLMGGPAGLTMADIAALGVRRVSVGSGLARVAWGAFMRAAKGLAERGSFDGMGDAVPFAEINGFFRKNHAERSR